MPQEPESPTDAEIANVGKMLSHSVRVYVLRQIMERGEAAPTDLVDGSDASLGTISFHVRTLADLGALKLVRKEPRRGALKNFYAVPPEVQVQVRAVLEALRVTK